jgi:oxaloacetate decarboxylase gamma subunit
METNLIMEGVKFMFLGMGTVFVFLIVMIVCMNIMSSVINRYFPEPQANADSSSAGAQKDTKKIVAAITAAVKYHRQG